MPTTMAPLAWRKCRLSFAGTSGLAELVRLSQTSIADEIRERSTASEQKIRQPELTPATAVKLRTYDLERWPGPPPRC